MNWIRKIQIAVGVWLLVSPWILGFSGLDLVTWNVVAAGSVLILLSTWDYASKE